MTLQPQRATSPQVSGDHHPSHYLPGVQYIFHGCAVLVDDARHYVETRFADGTSVGATPNRDSHSLRTAGELGYGDNTFAMSRDHELAHAWLAMLEGRLCSPTIWRLAHPYGDDLPNDDEVAIEEARVLTFQHRLDKRGPRPWDLADVPLKVPLAW